MGRSREVVAARKLAAAGTVSGPGADRPWNGQRFGRGRLRRPLAIMPQAVAGDRACHIAAGRRGWGASLDRRLRNGQQWLGERKTWQCGRDDDGGKLRHVLLIGAATGGCKFYFLRDACAAADI